MVGCIHRGFATSYRQLPASAREQRGLKVLGLARDYRAKHRFRLDPNLDQGVADAFKLLDEKNPK
ncbi:MAG: hypothetical protein C5B50_10490 [Verrucomicrobia bacterium]|nr:MAG: hypothetical protein C5B50_10490 [Verrucomicrobiota bacterium]